MATTGVSATCIRSRNHRHPSTPQNSSRTRRKKVSFAGIELDNNSTDEKNILPSRLRPRGALSQKAIEKEKQLMMYVALGRASSWKGSYLDWLLVDVKEDDLERLLLDKIQSKSLTWTSAHQAAVDNAITQLKAYKVKDLVADENDIDLTVKAVNFSQTYQALSVMAIINSSNTDAINSTHQSRADSIMSHASSISDSSDISQLSATSKSEPEVRNLKAVFLSESLRSLGILFRRQQWKDKLIRFEYRATESMMKFIVCPHLNGGIANDGGTAKVSGEKVTVKNDGGFVIEYHNGKKWTYNPKWPYAMSTESKLLGVKYTKDEKKNVSGQCEITAQIFAELLGQTLFDNWTGEPGSITHQEAFLIHARHATFYLYYCRFSITYLQNFVQHGINLDENSTERVSLLKSRPYNIFKTSDRVECFKLIAYLIFYLNSGEADIRYLKNDETNPLWRDLFGEGIQYDLHDLGINFETMANDAKKRKTMKDEEVEIKHESDSDHNAC